MNKFLDAALFALLVTSYVFFAHQAVVLKNTLFVVKNGSEHQSYLLEQKSKELKLVQERLHVFEYCSSFKDEKEAQCFRSLL